MKVYVVPAGGVVSAGMKVYVVPAGGGETLYSEGSGTYEPEGVRVVVGADETLEGTIRVTFLSFMSRIWGLPPYKATRILPWVHPEVDPFAHSVGTNHSASPFMEPSYRTYRYVNPASFLPAKFPE